VVKRSSSQRYRDDPEYRELHKKRVRLSYFRKKQPVVRPPTTTLQTRFYADLEVHNPEDIRFGEKVVVPVYRIGEYAALLGKSDQTVRLWIRDGRLPEPTFVLDEGGRRGRAYTYDQMRVTWEYLPLLAFGDSRDVPPPKPKPSRYEKGRFDPDYKRALGDWKAAMAEHRYDHNPFSRLLKEAWARMPDGLIVLHAKGRLGAEPAEIRKTSDYR